MPAKAGIHEHKPRKVLLGLRSWTPAFAGVTKEGVVVSTKPAQPSPSLREGEGNGIPHP